MYTSIFSFFPPSRQTFRVFIIYFHTLRKKNGIWTYSQTHRGIGWHVTRNPKPVRRRPHTRVGRGRVDRWTDVGARGGGTDRRQQVHRHGVHAGRPTSVRVGRPRQRGRVRLVGRDRRGTGTRAIRRGPADVLHRETHVRLPKVPVHHPARSPAGVRGRFREAARRGKSGAPLLTPSGRRGRLSKICPPDCQLVAIFINDIVLRLFVEYTHVIIVQLINTLVDYSYRVHSVVERFMIKKKKKKPNILRTVGVLHPSDKADGVGCRKHHTRRS